MAAKVPAGSADQYALLRTGGEIAAGAGEAPTALRAVERLAAQFDVPAAKLKAEALLTGRRQSVPVQPTDGGGRERARKSWRNWRPRMSTRRR